MRSQKPTLLHATRAGERGAALITAVLLSLLLLAAGGILILTSTMTSLTARDSTAEMQAYYGAEAGISRSLQILRGNVESVPTGTKATFHNVLCSRDLWTSTSGNEISVTEDDSVRFQVLSIADPDNEDLVTPLKKCEQATYKPDRLRIRVLGMGPGNSQKKMEVVVNHDTIDYAVNAVVTAQNETGNPFPFDLGDSNEVTTSGVDYSGSGATLPPFAISGTDYNSVNNVIDGCDPDGSNCGNGPNVTPDNPEILVSGNTPSFLKSVESARQFLYDPEQGMRQIAKNQGRYFATGDEAKASIGGLGATHEMLTFVDGDLVLGPGEPTGQGTLIVTGTLTLNGSFNWNGVIMVLGKGEVYRSGGGTGSINGAMFIAKFEETGATTDKFGAPVFDMSGGGNSTLQYSSDAVDMAKGVGGHSVKGVREY